MDNPYVSSIVTKYGDVAKVKADSKTLSEIQSRQGSSLLIDSIAEHVGNVVNKFNLNSEDSKRLMESLVSELKESILERI